MAQTITILDNDTIEIREPTENVTVKTRASLLSVIEMADRQIDASQATKDDALYWLNQLPEIETPQS
jgi:hypothetical protein